MAKITNVSSDSVLFRTRNNVSYDIPPGVTLTVPDAEVTYDTVDAALEAGKITVTTDAGVTFFDSYGRNPAEQQSGGGSGGGSAKDREFVVTTYRVKTAFTGASVGDTVTATQVIDVTDAPTTVTTIWRNQTTATDFASVPLAVNLELIGSQALTDAQLRAAAVVVSFASTPTINIGTMPEVEIKNDSGNPIPVSGSAAVGTPPAMPPISISGVDGAGNKQHIRTDTLGNIGIYGSALRSAATVSILNGASVSSSVDLTSTALLGFISPSAWTTAALTLEVSVDNVNWSTAVYDGSGSQVGYWSSLTVGSGYAVDTISMLPFRYIRLRSGTSTSPVAQAAQRDFVLVTRPLA